MNGSGAPERPILFAAEVPAAAHALRDAAQRATRSRFYVLPFNRFAVERSPFWVAPTSDNPAYAWGKVILTDEPEYTGESSRFVGLHVERGLDGPKARALLPEIGGQRLLLGPGWIWHDFVPALRSGDLAGQARTAEEAAGMPLMVGVAVALQRLPGYEPPLAPEEVEQERRRYLPDIARFACSDGRLAALPPTRRQGRLDTLGAVTTFAELVDALPSGEDAEWLWFELLLGVQATVAAPGTRGGAWDPDATWARACEPWRSWLRARRF